MKNECDNNELGKEIICPNAIFNEYRFKTTEKRLNAHSAQIDEHESRLAKAEANVEHVIKSVQDLTKAMWATAGSILLALGGFVLNMIR